MTLSYPWRVFTATSLGLLMTGLNSSMVVVALPAMVHDLDATPVQAQWMLLSFMLVNTVLILTLGRLSDLRGRRRVYVTGFVVMGLASLVCGLSTDASVLIGARLVQGAGGAALITNTTALLVDSFSGVALTAALGYNVAVAAAAQAAGPVVGGALVATLGWRSIFLANVPVALVGGIWAVRTIRRDRRVAAPGSLDLVGSASSLVVLGSILLCVSYGSEWGWLSARTLGLAALSGASATLFVVHQAHGTSPLLDIAMFRSPTFSTSVFLHLLMSLGRFGGLALTALVVQTSLGHGAFFAGVSVLPLSAGLLAGSVYAGRLSWRHAPQRVAASGCLIAATGFALLVLMGPVGVTIEAIAAGLLLVGVGNGVFMTPNTSLLMADVAPRNRGVVNGLRSALGNTGQALGTSLGLAVATAWLEPSVRSSVFSGTAHLLPDAQAAKFLDGYEVVLVALLVTTVFAALLALGRQRH